MARALRNLVWAVGIAATVFLAGFIVFAGSVLQYGRNGEARGEGIVVLTGGEQRIGEAVRLLGDGRGRRLLISGVNRHTSREELRRKNPLDTVLYDCCVDIGYAALDTIGNAEETRSWARTWGFSRLVIVTSSYHMPRSLAELGRVLPGVDLIPYAVRSKKVRAEEWWLHAATARLLWSEYLKLLPSVVRLAASRLWPERDGGDTRPSVHASKL